MLKYGDDSRKIESVMACFDRGGGKAPPPPAAYIPFYRLHLIGLKRESKTFPLYPDSNFGGMKMVYYMSERVRNRTVEYRE